MPDYAPDPGPIDIERIARIAKQGQFLLEHYDLISPWRVAPNDRLKIAHIRLQQAWKRNSVKE